MPVTSARTLVAQSWQIDMHVAHHQSTGQSCDRSQWQVVVICHMHVYLVQINTMYRL
jgi:anaerobic ribonucleoside-triphosphate reductase